VGDAHPTQSIGSCSVSGSREAGAKTKQVMRALAAAAAGAAARLPVDAHPTAGRDHSRAFAIATATGRSLNEYVGLTVSSLIQISPVPIALSKFFARLKGV